MGNLFEILLILFLTLLNGVFSMSETAIVSARRARLQQRADAGDEQAKAALELARQPDRFLSTVQIGITLIGILAGAFGGARLSEDLAAVLTGWGLSASTSQTIAFVLVVAVITYLSLVIGELVPKTLALGNAENIATRIAGPMNALSRLASPLVWLLSVSTNGILRILGVTDRGEQPVTEDEINILIAQGARAGVFAEEEREIVERVFRLGDRRVNALMTPRREIVFLDVEDSWEENRRKIIESDHSAFPVCEGGLDNLLGVVLLKHLWGEDPSEGSSSDGSRRLPVDLRAAADRPLYVLESTRALKVLETFKAERRHLALVVDEYGNMVGLLTLHDIMEGVVGEVPGMSGSGGGQDLSAVQREDGSWLLDGMLPLDEMMHLLDIREAPEDANLYTSLGGFVMARLGHVPSVGEVFDWGNLRFEVLDMDGNRVDRVLASPVKEETERGEAAAD